MLRYAFAANASANEHVVKMLNGNGKGKFMLFDPEIVHAKVGDTVKFLPTNKGHNAEMIPDLWPADACRTIPMGMIAAVVAGELTNKAQLDTYPPSGSAMQRYEALKA